MKYCDGMTTKKLKKSVGFGRWLAWIFIFLLIFMTQDFVTTLLSSEDSYEIKQEVQKDLDNDQKIYQLYVNGEYMQDVDYNEYSLLDSSGHTDYRYCALIAAAKKFSYSVILMLMLLVVIRIATDTLQRTPFTRENARRIRLVGILQFALAIVPVLITFLMKFFRFAYVSAASSINGVYMFVIGFGIMMIAQVFDYGVKLQQDSDSIA